MTYDCPNDCGSTTFEQTVKQTETVFVDEEGSPYRFEPEGHVDVLDVQCAECGAEVPEE